MSPTPGEDVLVCAGSLVQGLISRGVRHFVTSPGLSCTPLFRALEHFNAAGLRVWSHPDERSAAFLALGIGKASGVPAALICTHGSAPAHYLPAVIEARYSSTPMLVLSTDRPARLRDCGAPQTIDQVHLYNRYPLYFNDLPSCASAAAPRVWGSEAQRATAYSVGPPAGPVHLNLPIDSRLPEPVEDQRLLDGLASLSSSAGPPSDTRSRSLLPGENLWDVLAQQLSSARRALIICGPQNDDPLLAGFVVELARRLRCPVLADIASQLRFGPHDKAAVCAHYDLYLKADGSPEHLQPQVVLRLGDPPTSRRLRSWLGAVPRLHYVAIEPRNRVSDPRRRVTFPICSRLRHACTQLTDRLTGGHETDADFPKAWMAAEEAVADYLESRTRPTVAGEIFESDVVARVLGRAPADGIVFLANSMPIRLADSYAAKRDTLIRVLVNRGVNGIDGLTSSALGATLALEQPVVLLIGDLAFLHDLNGLWPLASHSAPLKIVLLNNSGGGIFVGLGFKRLGELTRSLLVTPHELDFSHACRLFSVPHRKTRTLPEFCEFNDDMLSTEEPFVLEVATCSETSRREEQTIVEAIRHRTRSCLERT